MTMLSLGILRDSSYESFPFKERLVHQTTEAANGTTSRWLSLPKALRRPLPASKAVVAEREHKKLQERCNNWWRASPRFNKTQRIDPTLPSKDFIKLVKDWPRTHSSILLQTYSTQTAPTQDRKGRLASLPPLPGTGGNSGALLTGLPSTPNTLISSLWQLLQGLTEARFPTHQPQGR
jgi:hypothetical protein